MTSNRNVVIVQRRLTNYRVPLFERLRVILAEDGINLRLLVGEPDAIEVLKRDEGHLDWAEKIDTAYWGGFCWQPFGRQTAGADLVIVTQENRLLYNLIALTIARPRRLAFWGHGRNMQSYRPNGIKERFKRWTTSKVDWWFAYTEMTRDFICQDGFPGGRVTVLDNSIDTSVLQQSKDAISEKDKVRLRNDFNIDRGPTGVFVGSLYESKRLGFLLESAIHIRRRLPNFCLLVVGDGPDRRVVEDFARRESWVRMLGSRHQREKMEVLAISDVLLNPGGVGLGILDSFVSGVPMVTTNSGNHGPEISYLKNNENGVIVGNSISEFSKEVVDLLSDAERLKRLGVGALNSAQQYSIEKMAIKFKAGIFDALRSKI